MATHVTGVKVGPYVLTKTLGVGSFGKVKLAQHELTGLLVAIKILNRKKIQTLDMDEKVRREIKTLKLFMHPHITRLYEVIDTPTDIFVVMEYVSEGELFDYIVEKGRLSEDDARRYFQQVISGVDYCHRHMVVHRDLKPENLLLDKDFNVKIADFGLSNVMRDGFFLKTSCGSPNYAAPEVISGKLYAGPEVDVWSCGVILYALLCGSLPFDDENIPNLFKKIKGGIYQLPGYMSAGARDLIPRMLVVDPMKRITIPEIRQHRWFCSNLPKYLALTADDRLISAKKLDVEAMGKVMALFGIDAPAARAKLNVDKMDRNEVTVAYHLLLDVLERQRRHASDASASGFLDDMRRNASSGSDMSDMSDGAAPSGSPRPEALPPPAVDEVQLAPPPIGGVVAASAARDEHREGVAQGWRLGECISAMHPAAIMAEVYRALALVGLKWKTVTPFQLKCLHELEPLSPLEAGRRASPRGLSPAPLSLAPGEEPPCIKLIVQIYKLPEGHPGGKYLLDFHKTSGDILSFVSVCKRLLQELEL